MQKSFTIFLLGFHAFLFAQPYTDYIGAGHSKGILTSSSSEQERENFYHKASADNTISGSGLIGRLDEASRFLYQATFGYTEKEAKDVIALGIENWIDNQKTIAPSKVAIETDSFYKVIYNYLLAQGEDSMDLSSNPDLRHFRYAWWNAAIHGKDQLRQRMAYALSQIFVLSDNSDLGGQARGLAAYHEILAKHAFGNYRNLLLDVSLNPCMGFYLSHLNNPREIPEENIHPDQNYAREIMQLFSIGLYMLNQDGSRILDSNGKPIPTYNNEDIAEMAKVFTGLGIGTALPEMDLYFGRGIYGSDLTKPMKMYEEWHQEGEKKLINNITIPSGQSGIEDIENAIDMLFNHPNTGPFICKQLIQRMVTSNPSPAYISRVVSAFNNNGSGVRGDLFAVSKAILMDEEARNCAYLSEDKSGKMIEPVLRYSNFLKAVGLTGKSKYFFNHAYDFQNATNQHAYSAPSVFNFYTQDFSTSGPIADNGLVAPEFKLLNTLTAINYPNLAYVWNYYEYSYYNWDGDDFFLHTNASKFFENAHDDEALVNHLDLIFTHGNMSEELRAIIKEAIKDIEPTLDGAKNKINMAIYLTLISPDYLIKK